VDEVKDSESNVGFEYNSKLEKGRQIIDAKPSANISTTKIHPVELDEPYEGECLFHLQTWVKGTLIHFIVDRGSQKNLISTEVVNRLALTTRYTYNHTPSNGSVKEAIFTSTNNATYPTTSSPSKMRYCVMSLPLKFVMLFWVNLIYRNIMMYMILGLAVLLFLWTGNCTGYLR
jgi:hypothetical protein